MSEQCFDVLNHVFGVLVFNSIAKKSNDIGKISTLLWQFSEADSGSLQLLYGTNFGKIYLFNPNGKDKPLLSSARPYRPIQKLLRLEKDGSDYILAAAGPCVEIYRYTSEQKLEFIISDCSLVSVTKYSPPERGHVRHGQR